MSWKIALTVALLTAVITAIVTAPVADRMTKLHGVSDFEGGRGMAIAFLFIPAGFIGGFLLGLLCTKLVGAVEWTQFWKAAGLSVLLAQIALFGIAGFSMLNIPRPPLLDGVLLALEVEVMIPLVSITPRALEPDQIRISLYAGPQDNAYATTDPALFRKEDGLLVVRALAPLNSKAYGRTLGLHIEESAWLAFDLDLLPAAPTHADLAWSGRKAMRNARSTDMGNTLSDVVLRYLVTKSGSAKD